MLLCVQHMNNGINISFYLCISMAADENVSRVTTKKRQTPFKPGFYSLQSVTMVSAGH